MILIECVQTSTKPFDVINFIASIGSILVSIIVIITGYCFNKRALKTSEMNTRKTLLTSSQNTDKTIASKRIEERKSEIYKKLNEFYQPLFEYRQKSTLLYLKFKEKFVVVGPDESASAFRTLTYLLNRNEFTGNEKALLEEIINIGKLCEDLIHKKAGLIDDDSLRKDWLPRLTTHLLILRMAYQKKLSGEPEKFIDLAFPLGIDELIEERIKVLQQELKELG
jgi:hypothetical protein